MKSKFNKSWNRSVQPRKQVKFRANAPNHILRKFMGAPLDKTLRTKYGRRAVEVTKNDEVKVMRGKFKGKHGKVTECDVKHGRIQIDGINKARKSGDKIAIWFNPSNVKIVLLNDKDSRRLKKKEKTGRKEEGKKKEKSNEIKLPEAEK